MEIDHNTGVVLDAIDDAGVRDHTIVVWFSDNGPTRYSPEADHNGDPGPWSGELGSAWEGGLRTAGMMRWPGKIKSNWVSDETFHVMDLYVTLGNIAGGDVPTDRPIDGVDQTAFLTGKQINSARDHCMVFFYGELTAIRWRQFKAHFIVYERFKSLTQPGKKLGVLPRIHNLRADPKELYDLMGRSGGTPMFMQFQKVAAPYLASFQKFPNRDYSKITRSR
jgi:arylsulfatase